MSRVKIATGRECLLLSRHLLATQLKSYISKNSVDSQVRSGSSKYSSRVSSRTSRVASVEAARIKEAARFAELEAEKAMLEKRQVLEERKFRLSQEETRLNLDAEIAKSAAKGQASAGIFRPPDQPPVHLSSQESKCMIKEGVSPTVARRLNYSERSGKVVDTRSQSNANHESVARVTIGPPDADKDLVCTPPRGNASRESTVRVATGPPVADTNFSIDPDYLQLEAVTLQRQQAALQAQQNRIVELLAVNQNKTKLPQPRVPIFDGNPVDYRSFIRAFESLIESRTCNSTERLYYLEQYTTGDVKELIKSCHHLHPDVGYEEARKLLKKKFGNEYRVASAYESKALAWPPIKAEDCTALNKFAILVSSCKNALAGSQYASRFDQPGNIQKLIFKFPFNMRERWRRSADDIMERQSRPVEFNDLVAFMDREARIATNPVFGNISDNAQPFFNRRKGKLLQPPIGARSSKPKTATFANQVKTNQSMNLEKNPGADLASSDVPSIVCIFCQQNHALEDCHLLRWKPYQERIKFLSAKRLCFGCLSEKHVASFALKEKSAKFQTALVSIP